MTLQIISNNSDLCRDLNSNVVLRHDSATSQISYIKFKFQNCLHNVLAGQDLKEN